MTARKKNPETQTSNMVKFHWSLYQEDFRFNPYSNPGNQTWLDRSIDPHHLWTWLRGSGPLHLEVAAL